MERKGAATPPEPKLAAGHFSSWLGEMEAAIQGRRDADVPCDGCTACCRSSQFILIAPDETETLAHIPAGLLFPAPRMPHGHVVLGYDERGHCPMLIDDRCSIYEHRPRTCRAYDCRVLPATGLRLEEEAQALIARRVRRWRFTVRTPEDRARLAAVRAAAAYLRAHPEVLPDSVSLSNSTQVAALAIVVHRVFLPADPAVPSASGSPESAVVRAEIARTTGVRRGSAR